jgi:glycosyltransferase involved in cell wall biosynthesis
LSLKQAVCFHATAENEYQEIRALGLQQPVCIIPNGIDIPDLSPEKVSHKRTLLFLGRIHPTKGVDYLLRAWHVVYRQFPEWELEIVGPDNEGYLFKMKRLASKLRLERVLFRGPLYGRDKERAYQRADIFVLPTHSENFGLAVAESLACGTPAIVTKGAPWEGLEKNNAGWWIDIGVEPLVSCLQKAMKLERGKLAQMGSAGREWMKREFSWKKDSSPLRIGLKRGDSPDISFTKSLRESQLEERKADKSWKLFLETSVLVCCMSVPPFFLKSVEQISLNVKTKMAGKN